MHANGPCPNNYNFPDLRCCAPIPWILFYVEKNIELVTDTLNASYYSLLLGVLRWYDTHLCYCYFVNPR